MNKEKLAEFVICAKLAIATCEDPHLSIVSVDRSIQQLETAISNLSSKEKSQEPVGFQVRSFYTKNEWTGNHRFETTKEVEDSNGEWRYVYTDSPTVAELQKQVQALQAELKAKDDEWSERVDTSYRRGYDQGYSEERDDS